MPDLPRSVGEQRRKNYGNQTVSMLLYVRYSMWVFDIITYYNAKNYCNLGIKIYQFILLMKTDYRMSDQNNNNTPYCFLFSIGKIKLLTREIKCYSIHQ